MYITAQAYVDHYGTVRYCALSQKKKMERNRAAGNYTTTPKIIGIMYEYRHRSQEQDRTGGFVEFARHIHEHELTVLLYTRTRLRCRNQMEARSYSRYNPLRNSTPATHSNTRRLASNATPILLYEHTPIAQPNFAIHTTSHLSARAYINQMRTIIR